MRIGNSIGIKKSFAFKRFGKNALAVSALWSAAVAVLFLITAYHIRGHVREMAVNEARGYFMRNLTLRHWAMRQERIYVPITGETGPSASLSHMPERDITTPSGMRLTLLSPQTLVRQFAGDLEFFLGVKEHITSRELLRPENAADKWEAESLKSFETGNAREALATADIGGEPYLRLMRPVITTPDCLGCHAGQGYELGDIRGGISITVPMKEYYALTNSEIFFHGLQFGAVWLAGIAAIAALSLRSSRHDAARQEEMERLEGRNRLLSALESAESMYILKESPPVLFDAILGQILSLTDSEYGFIGEVLHSEDGAPYLKTHAVTNIAWNEETRKYYDERSIKGMEFRNLKTLFGDVMLTGRPVIANDPANDSRRGGLPEGHPPLKAFLGVPFYYGDKMVGMIGLANRPGGYGVEAVVFLNPLLALCGNIINSYREAKAHAEAERAVEEGGKLLQSVIDGIAEPIMVIGLDYKVMLMNRAVREMYCAGSEAAGCVFCYRLSHGREVPCEGDEHSCPIKIVRATGKTAVVVHQHLRPDGEKRYVEIMASPLRDSEGNITAVIESSRDITGRMRAESEKKALESQFLQAQKLESLGRLASGVAHDFNNLLSAIVGYSEMALMQLPGDSPIREYISVIKSAGDKAASLTRQLLAFSRKQVLEMKAVNLDGTIENISKMLRRLIGEDVSLELKLGAPGVVVKADHGQIEQVVMNLAVNARDAMPGGGVLGIETKSVTLEENDVFGKEGLRPGRHIILSVRDSGTGIKPEHIGRIFEPFFTTKERGKGTGLGLSTVFGIVKQHGGHIEVESGESGGTEFRIYLPAIESGSAAHHEVHAPDARPGKERVMVVEDEASILSLVRDTLVPLGYSVYTASSGEEALRMCRETGCNVDVLLIDVILPGMDGVAFARAAIAEHPDVSIIFMSGYPDDLLTKSEFLRSEENFIQKPLTPSVLAAKLRKVLDKKA